MRIFHRLFGDRAYWHWQNLDEDRQGRKKGHGWRHGRAWFNFRVDREEGRDRNSIGVGTEWVLARFRLSRPLSLRFALGEGDADDEAEAHLSVFGNALYLSLDAPIARQLSNRLCPKDHYRRTRDLSFAIHDSGLWWRLWANPDSWERGRPKWRDGHLDVTDLVLGKNRYQRVVLEERDIVVPMPEKSYPAEATLELCTWTRQRFGWPAKRVVRVEIKVEGGIPHPGKGENAWDCDDDATHSITTSADTIEEGIAKLVHSVLRDRMRYGGKSWQPRESLLA